MASKKNMWEWLNESMGRFERCFNRRTTFCWFVIILLGLMLRSDHLGISSIVREFGFMKHSYPAMIHFFRSEGWQAESIRYAWLMLVSKLPVIVKETGRYIMVGDGVKHAKEGRRMPGVKKLRWESENSSKAEYMHGHFFGGLGLLAGNGKKLYCVLISLKLHDGMAAFQKWWGGGCHNEESHVAKMIRDAAWAVKYLGESILLLDRLYLTMPMLDALAGTPGLSVVTMAKSNAVAYCLPGPYKGRGARPKKGPCVKLASLFPEGGFTAEKMELYGKEGTVRYRCVDLLWGKGMYRPLRFVLTVLEDGRKSILVSTDLTLSPTQMIRLYCRRFRIEGAFRELKQVVAGFSYHFWSKSMPKLQKFKKNGINQENLENVSEPRQRELIQATVKAIEGFAQISAIALGMLQLVGLLFGREINHEGRRFMRTVSNEVPSERTVADFMRKNIYMLFGFFPNLALTSIIRKHQMDYFDVQNDLPA